MMKKELECKIVQDLLPNYLDGLTDEETNKFIEAHIENCHECKEIIESIKNYDENEKDIDTNGKEIKPQNPFKKVKRMYHIRILIAIITTILVLAGGLYFITNYRIQKDDTGKIVIHRYSIDEKKMANCRNIIIKTRKKKEATIDGYVYYTYVLSVNKDNICVNARIKEEGYKEEYVLVRYNEYVKNNPLNKKEVSIAENSILYNSNDYIGKKLDKVEKIINNISQMQEKIEY